MQRPELRKIVFLGFSSEAALQAVRDAAPDAEIVVANTPEERAQHLPTAQLTLGRRMSDDEIASAKELVWHHVPWVGVEGTLTPALVARGILITNGSGVNSPNIAEHVVAMMLAFARQIPQHVRGQERHHWREWEAMPNFFEIGGQTVVCLGTGSIGENVARCLSGFGCTLIGASRSGRQVHGFDRCVTFAELAEVLPLADHVVSSLPMTPGTAEIVNAERISQMKQGAYFYNVGRGATVDQDALVAAIEAGHLAGAGLDVVTPEPLPEGSPLWNVPNVLITSHSSGSSPQARQRVADLIRTQIQRYRAGEELLNVVDQTAGY